MSRPSKDEMKRNIGDMFGLNPGAGMSDMEASLYGNVEGNADLEAELSALMGDQSGGHRRQAPPPSKRPVPAPAGARSKAAGGLDLSVLQDDDDEDIDVSEDDPELLAELAAVVGGGEQRQEEERPTKASSGPGVSLPVIEDRLNNYKAAVAAAKAANESSKVRRYERALNSLEDIAKKAKRGQAIPEDDLPPPVPVKNAAPAPAPPAAQVITPPRPSGQQMVLNYVNSAPTPAQTAPSQDDKSKILQVLSSRQTEYKSAALKAKNEGNIGRAKQLIGISKQFDEVIAAVREGREFDISDMPPHPDQFETSPDEPPAPPAPAGPAPSAAPTDMAGELQSRLSKFLDTKRKAEAEGNSSKARRIGRIVQQYEEAVKACRAKKPYSYDELPPPPGCDALPSGTPAAARQPPAGPAAAPGNRPSPVAHAPMARPAPGGKPGLTRQLSRSSNQQLVFLQERQNRFKVAALQARNRGELESAKQLLRQSKGFDPMIQAAESGLPVDLSKLPVLPGENEVDFDFLEAEECETPDDLIGGDSHTVYERLKATLLQQFKTAQGNASRFLKMGEVSTAGKFEKLAKTCRLDLDAVSNAASHGDPVPRFHYEWKTFNILSVNPDLGENELELEIVRGSDLPLPSGYSADQLDTFVKLEFPFPSDSPQSHQTDYVKHTNSPEYASSVKFQVSRKSRAFLRVIQNKTIKAEIFYRRGFLKKDGLLATVPIKLAKLETSCKVHGSFDLMDGRKVIAGKLEVKARLREPLHGKQMEELREKWLVIDDFNRPARVPSTGPSRSDVLDTCESVEVMRYEFELLHTKIQQLRAQLTPDMLQTLEGRQKTLQSKVAATQAALKRGGLPEVKKYLAVISQLPTKYTQEAQAYLKQGDRNKAQILMTKKKLVEKEVAGIQSRFPK